MDKLIFATTEVSFFSQFDAEMTIEEAERLMGGPPEEVDASPIESVEFDAILMGVS